MTANDQQNIDPEFANFAGLGGFKEMWKKASEQNDEPSQDFEELYGNFKDFFALKQQKGQKGRDVIVIMTVSFEEAVHGIVKQVVYSKSGICNTCNEAQLEVGTKEEVCDACLGTGFLDASRKNVPCMVCDGGRIWEKCFTCSGAGILTSEVEETVRVPRGINNGINLRLPQKGNSSTGKNQISGDLIVQMEVEKHPYFKRRGANIHTDLNLNLSDAIFGIKASIQTVIGKTTSLIIPPGTQHGQRFVIDEAGVPHQAGVKSARKGDHIVNIIVAIPSAASLTKEQHLILSEFQKTEGGRQDFNKV